MVVRKGHGPANVMRIVRGLVIVSLLFSARSGIVDAQAADKAEAKAVDGFSAAVATAGDILPLLRTGAQTVVLRLQVTWRRPFGKAEHRKYKGNDASHALLFSLTHTRHSR